MLTGFLTQVIQILPRYGLSVIVGYRTSKNLGSNGNKFEESYLTAANFYIE
ncbi:MAG: hypothetical protein ACE5K3_03530 [bacterium]